MFEELNLLDKSLVYNVYVVRTPFQFINAYETLDYFKTKNNILVIIDNGTENNKKQLSQQIDEKYWHTIVRFGDQKESNFMNYVNLIKKLKKLNIDTLFTSSGFNKMQQIIIANCNSKKTCLFDQGTGTILTYKLFQNSDINKFNLKKLRFFFLGLKTKINKNIDFFTMFDFKDLPKSKIYKNSYDFVKKKYNLDNKKLTDEVFIIGQKLVKSNMVTQEEYFEYLDNILDTYKGYKINYLMHRTEDKEYLIENKYNSKMNLLESTKPGEIYFLELDTQPKVIIGNVSALLISLKYIFKDINIISYRFKNENFIGNKEYVLAYENMKQSGIKIIDL